MVVDGTEWFNGFSVFDMNQILVEDWVIARSKVRGSRNLFGFSIEIECILE